MNIERERENGYFYNCVNDKKTNTKPKERDTRSRGSEPHTRTCNRFRSESSGWGWVGVWLPDLWCPGSVDEVSPDCGARTPLAGTLKISGGNMMKSRVCINCDMLSHYNRITGCNSTVRSNRIGFARCPPLTFAPGAVAQSASSCSRWPLCCHHQK